MKKLVTLFSFLMMTAFAQAQLVEVIFAVDMNNVTDFNPAGGVFVAGAFQSWTPSAGALADADDNGVWHRSYMLAPGTYQYKFGIGADWGNNEGGGLADCGVDDGNGAFNREITVTAGSAPRVLAFVYNGCAPATASYDGMVDVTLAVNVTNVSGFDPAGGMFVAGEFQGWNPGGGALSDEDGNSVWARTYRLAPGTYLYKFGIGNNWGNNEGSGLAACGVDDNNGGFNRQLVVPSDVTSLLQNFMYDSCDESGLPVNVTNVSTISGVEVFPNPMTQQATIRFENPSNAAHSIWLTNMAGQVVRQYNGVRGTQVNILRDGLQSGLYFVTFRNERGERGSLKLMIQ